MAKITQKQLIESLKQMKEIKPRKEWAVLLKSQILAEKQTEIKMAEQPAKSFGIMDMFSSLFFQRKLAYSFAALAFIVVGLVGFAKYTMPGDLLFPIKKISEQSQAALSGQTTVRQNVVALSNRINDLAQVAKDGKKDNVPSAISKINANAKDLAQNLKANPVQDSETIKELTNSAKALADIPGTDLTNNPDVIYIYQTLDQNQIADLQKLTLTDDQNKVLAEAQDLYGQGEYEKAFEVLLTNNLLGSN